MAQELTGMPFLEGFVNDLRLLEEAFTPEAHSVAIKFTRPQVRALIDAIDVVLSLNRVESAAWRA